MPSIEGAIDEVSENSDDDDGSDLDSDSGMNYGIGRGNVSMNKVQ